MLKKYEYLCLLTFLNLCFCSSLFSKTSTDKHCNRLFIQIPYANNSYDFINSSETLIYLSNSSPYKVIFTHNDKVNKRYDELWKLPLKTEADVAQLFLNLVEKADLSLDDAIWTLVQLSSKLKEINQLELVWTIDKVIADIVGLGDIFDRAVKIVGVSFSSDWADVFNLWNKLELQKTYEEYSKLKPVILGHNLNSTRLLQQISESKNIYQVFDHDSIKFLKLVDLGSKIDHTDLIFWETYTKKLLQKTIDVIDRGFKTTSELLALLSSRADSVPFLRDYSKLLKQETETVLDILMSFKNIAQKRNESNFFKNMPFAHSASNYDLYRYLSNQTASLFFPTWKHVVEHRFIIKRLDNSLRQFSNLAISTYNLILKDTSLNPPLTHRYDYFSDLPYVSTNESYHSYLTGKYGPLFTKKLLELIENEK